MANIAVLSLKFPPASIGGAQVQAEAWARNLASAHRVTVITGRGRPDLPRCEEQDGYAIEHHMHPT